MGGGDSSQKPYDLLGGSGASFSGGTPGFDWSGALSGVGSGLQSFGKGLASGYSSTPELGKTPDLAQSQIGTGAPYNLNSMIPQPNIDDAILRLLGGYG